jgi:hypothetical protein
MPVLRLIDTTSKVGPCANTIPDAATAITTTTLAIPRCGSPVRDDVQVARSVWALLGTAQMTRLS